MHRGRTCRPPWCRCCCHRLGSRRQVIRPKTSLGTTNPGAGRIHPPTVCAPMGRLVPGHVPPTLGNFSPLLGRDRPMIGSAREGRPSRDHDAASAGATQLQASTYAPRADTALTVWPEARVCVGTLTLFKLIRAGPCVPRGTTSDAAGACRISPRNPEDGATAWRSWPTDEARVLSDH